MVNSSYHSLILAGHQWLQMDLGPPKLINGIVTKGRGDKKNWVTSYSISYSNDTKIWFYYKDANHLEAKVDNHSVSQNYHVSCGDLPQQVDALLDYVTKVKTKT